MPDWQFRQPEPKPKEIKMDWNIVEGNWKQFKDFEEKNKDDHA